MSNVELVGGASCFLSRVILEQSKEETRYEQVRLLRTGRIHPMS